MRVLVQRHRIAGRAFDRQEERDLRSILGELRLERRGPTERASAIDLALLELASLGWSPPSRLEQTRHETDPRRTMARLGMEELERQLARELDPPLAAVLADEILDRSGADSVRQHETAD